MKPQAFNFTLQRSGYQYKPDTYYSNANLRVRLKTQFLFISDYKEQMAFSVNCSQIAWDWRENTGMCIDPPLKVIYYIWKNIHPD